MERVAVAWREKKKMRKKNNIYQTEQLMLDADKHNNDDFVGHAALH